MSLRAHDYVAGLLTPEARTEAVLRQILAEIELVKAHLAARIEPRLLTVDQAAAYIGRTRKGVEHLIAENAFAVVRYKDRVHVDRKVLDAWITRNSF
jgi:hypothetical protein